MTAQPGFEAALGAVLGASPIGALATDADATIVWANAAAAGLLGIGTAALAGGSAAAVLGDEAAGFADGVHRLARGTGSRADRALQCAVSPLAALPGGRLWLLTDLETRGAGRAAVLAGIDASRLDSVTGVLNRRTVLQQLQAEISRSRRYGNPLSVALVRLEAIAGDDGEAGRNVAEALNEALRWVDAVGALATDELVVVLPETDSAAAERVAAKLRASLAGAGAGCSVITAGWSGDDDVDQLLARLRGA